MANGPVTAYDFGFSEWEEGGEFGGASNYFSPEDFATSMGGFPAYGSLYAPKGDGVGADISIENLQKGLISSDYTQGYGSASIGTAIPDLHSAYGDYSSAYETGLAESEAEWNKQQGLFDLYGIDPKTNKPYTEESYGLHQQGLEDIEAERINQENIKTQADKAEYMEGTHPLNKEWRDTRNMNIFGKPRKELDSGELNPAWLEEDHGLSKDWRHATGKGLLGGENGFMSGQGLLSQIGQGGDSFMGKFGTGEGKIAQMFTKEEETTEQIDSGETVEDPPPATDPVEPEDTDEDTPTNEVSDKKEEDPWLKFASLVQKFGEKQRGQGFQYKSLNEMRGGRRGRS